MLFAKYYGGKKVFGVQTELTEEDLEALERAKRIRGRGGMWKTNKKIIN